MAWSLDFFAAEALAKADPPVLVRRVGWVDKWLMYRGGVWGFVDLEGEGFAVVRATEFAEADLEARDFTDEEPEADICGATPAFNAEPPMYGAWTSETVMTPPPPPGFPDPAV